jgi:hypothetical protein
LVPAPGIPGEALRLSAPASTVDCMPLRSCALFIVSRFACATSIAVAVGGGAAGAASGGVLPPFAMMFISFV